MAIGQVRITSNTTVMDNSSLVLAILWAFKNGFVSFTSNPITIVQYASTNASLNYQNDLINAALQESWTHDIDARTTILYDDMSHMRQSVQNTVYMRYEIAIWFVDSLLAFRRLEMDLMNESNQYSRKGYFCLVYTGKETQQLTIVKQIFHRLFTLYVLNVNLFIVFWEITYVYTYYPFADRKCRSVKPMLRFRFGHTNEERAYEPSVDNFFEDKLANMHRCQLVVVTWNHHPYVFVNNHVQQPSSVGHLLTGLEGELFMLLAAKINFTISLLVPTDRNRGTIFQNGTCTGAVKMIVDGMANITFVAFMYNELRSRILDPTTSYLSFPIVLCVPRGHQMSSFERLLKPFTYTIWLCFSTTLMLAFSAIIILMVYSTARTRLFVLGHHNNAPLTNLWATLFGNVMVTAIPRLNFARYLLTAWLLYGLVFRTAYTGELYKLLQDGRTRTIVKTVKELVQLNYVFYIAPALEKLFQELIPNKRVHLLNKDTDVDECLQKLQTETDMVLPLLLPTVLAFNQLPENTLKRVNILEERLFTAPLTMYLRKHSYLKNRFDILLMNLMSTGIVRKLEKQYLDSKRSSLRSDNDNEPIRLTLALLWSLFVVYLISVAFSLLIFILELTARRSARLHRLFIIANQYLK